MKHDGAICPLCMIFMILVSLENVKKYSHVVARLPQTVHLSCENETKIVKITHSVVGAETKG